MYDFETTFPPPTEAAHRELVMHDHYPDPDDAEACHWHWQECASEYAGYLNAAAAIRQVAAFIEQYGIYPAGKQRRVKDVAAEVQRNLEEAEEADDHAFGILCALSNVYGEEAAEAFRQYVVGGAEPVALAPLAPAQLTLF